MAGQVQVESMKFSEQKLQDIGLGTCLPAEQLRKGLEAKPGAETELPLQLCWQAGTHVPQGTRLTTGQLREENITQTKQAQELVPTTLYLLNGT